LRSLLVVDPRLFELDRRQVVEGAVESLAVVEHLDEFEDGPPDLSTSRPGLAVDQLGFQGGEPALTDGIIPALPFSRKALAAPVI
jgi:hypothetical protein